MIQRPESLGAFEFVVLATLRAAQLMRGCISKVDGDGVHKATVIAQVEVAAGKVAQVRNEAAHGADAGLDPEESPPAGAR